MAPTEAMDVKLDPQSAASAPRRIRLSACLIAFMSGCFGIGASLNARTNLPLAICVGLAVAFIGFGTWMVYHRISGQNNGLFMAGMPWAGVLQDRVPDFASLPKFIFINGMAWLTTAYLMGLLSAFLARRYNRRRDEWVNPVLEPEPQDGMKPGE